MPIIGIVQDCLLGSYNLTAPNMRIDWRDAMNIISYTSIDDFSAFKKDKEFTGVELFSMIIPANISSKNAGLEVQNGIIKSGQVTKSHLGSKKSNSLIHLIWDEYGADETKNFLDNVQRLVNNFNLINGFTVGIGDIDISPKLEEDLHKLFEKKKLEVDHLITEIENNPDLMDPDMFELSIYNDLNALRGDVSKMIMENLKENNNFKIMQQSGSKGEEVNTGQMVGCLGQQAVEGKRIQKKVNNRSLPYFFQNDDSARARGFIEHSFLRGTSPTEFMFHNMSSREGLIDTAIKTAESGYIQRKLVKCMEDAMVKYDLTVRNANNTIIQFIYGDSGIDSTKQYQHKLNLFKMGNQEIRDKYMFTDAELKNFNFTPQQNQDYYRYLLSLRDEMRYSKTKISLNYIIIDNTFMLPVNLNRIVDNVKNSKSTSNELLEPSYVLDRIEDMLTYKNTKITCMNNEDSTDMKSMKLKDEMLAKILFRFALHEYLSPKVSIFNLKLNKAKFDKICEIIIEGFNRSVAEPGEMGGTIAAQSIGEPVTQMTLNSIDWKEKIIIVEDGKVIIVEIGKYIDQQVELGINVSRLGDNTTEEKGDVFYVDTKDKNIFTISVDAHGKVSWNKIEALTKHLPINKDGTNDLVKIKTRLGRTVSATKAKSFLTRQNNEIVFTRGDEIKIGMHVPIMINFPEMDTVDELDLAQYFPKDQYTYGSEIEKARKSRKKHLNIGADKWFQKFNAVKFTVPYASGETLSNVLNGVTAQVYKPGCVYTKKVKNATIELPEKVPLDEDFGFLIGAYLAEGLATLTYVCISNNDASYRKKISDWCDKYKIGHHTVIQENKIQQGWTSSDIRIHCVLLARLFKQICNTGSEHKYIPDFAYNAPKIFVKGLLNGYFSGDGCVGKKKDIMCTSISEKMIDGIAILLTKFGIVAKKSKPTKIETNNRGSKDIKQHYTLSIRNENIHKFAREITMIIDYKQKRLNEILEHEFKTKNGIYDIVPGNNLECVKGTVHKNIVQDLINCKTVSHKDKNILQRVLDADVYYDEIVSIELVKPTNKYVYDLTVEKDKTFATFSGILCADTFHHVKAW